MDDNTREKMMPAAREFIDKEIKALPINLRWQITNQEREQAATYCAEFAAEQVAQQQQWVAVADKLPEDDGTYLVTVDDDTVDEPTTFVAFYFGDRIQRFTTPDVYQADIGNVIAWRELPEPYNETDKTSKEGD